MSLNPLTKWTTVTTGPQGTRETLRIMRTLALHGSKFPAMRDFVSQLERRTDSETLIAFDNTVRRIFRYRGEINELIRTPEHMLEHLAERGFIEGDCDDIATFSGSVCASLHIPCRFVAIRTNPDSMDFKHVFCEAKPDMVDNWYRLDATVSAQTDMLYYGQRMEQTV